MREEGLYGGCRDAQGCPGLCFVRLDAGLLKASPIMDLEISFMCGLEKLEVWVETATEGGRRFMAA